MSASSLSTPLRFERIHVPKPWGGRALEDVLQIRLPPQRKIGETWELVDRDGTNSIVADGPFAGRRLGGLMLSEREALLGAARPAASGAFPLLIKLLSAEETLSIQVHPDDETARALHEDEGGKDECWYVLDARPDAHVYLGLREGISGEEFAASAQSHELCETLQTFPVRAGDFVFVPAGTVHAIGGGITLVEIQQNSDLTYRLHDWGRLDESGEPRTLHVAEALRAATFAPVRQGPHAPELRTVAEGLRGTTLADAAAFRVDLLEIDAATMIPTEGVAKIVVVVAGDGTIAEQPVHPGETWLVPAASGEFALSARAGALRVLLITTKG